MSDAINTTIRPMSKAASHAADEINPATVPMVTNKKRLIADFEHHSISARLILDQLRAESAPLSLERFAELTIAAEQLQVEWHSYVETWEAALAAKDGVHRLEHGPVLRRMSFTFRDHVCNARDILDDFDVALIDPSMYEVLAGQMDWLVYEWQGFKAVCAEELSAQKKFIPADHCDLGDSGTAA